MGQSERMLMSGNEAVALAARDVGIALASAYPGTPSTEILEEFSKLGGKAQWSPNEKVAYEVALGAAFSTARAMVTMKHVGLNVAADPLFTSTYTGVSGALVVVSADDPGMASSQNEQDNRHYSRAAGIPTLEPSDSQEAYDLTFLAVELSERWRIPVMLRMTTRICHSMTLVTPRARIEPVKAEFEHDRRGRVMIPGNAKPAHRRLRAKLAEMKQWNEKEGPNRRIDGETKLGIITSGVSFVHAREAAPEASVLKIGMSYPLPMDTIRSFVESVDRCVVIEEGDPYLHECIRAEGLDVEGKADVFRFNELNVNRVRAILAGETTEELQPFRGKPPQLCKGCPHRTVFEVLGKLDCIVTGDIGCYTLGVLPPFEAMDSCVCMGASVGTGLGLRHVLPDDQAKRVVSVIGDSTFVHSGITGMVEMIYNPPKTGHVLIILDNNTTAMTGLQEHPGTGRQLDYEPTNRVVYEDLAETLGIRQIDVTDPTKDAEGFEKLVSERLAGGELCLIVVRRPCLLGARKVKKMEQLAAEGAS